jgi:glycosyltransferase involved in cell wall biosynthesis
MLISIVIPVYNSTVTPIIADRVAAVFAGRTEQYELIFVDDFSSDERVWPLLSELSTRDPRVRATQLTRNFGQHAATVCGLREAQGDIVITLDDDLEHNPDEIPKFLALADRDVVLAQFRQKHHSLFNRAASRTKGFFDWQILGTPRNVRFSSYRMLSRVVVDGILSIHTSRPFIPALILHVTKDLAGVDIAHQPRKAGRSHYTLAKRLRLFSDLMIHNSSLLLRLVGQVGVLMAVVSFAVASTVIYRKLMHGRTIQGWTSLMAAELLIGGLLLFGLGVIGEYLIRIIESSDARPTYFVRRRAEGKRD